MNSSTFSLYVLPSTYFSVSRESRTTELSVLDSDSFRTSAMLVDPFNGMATKKSLDSRTSYQDTQLNYTATGGVMFTQMFSRSVSTDEHLNKTKKSSENGRGVNVVTILLVVSSCFLLWIIIIIVGLIRQRIEKRKQNSSSRREGGGTSELDVSHDRMSRLPLDERARMIYRGLLRYDISTCVPNGVTNLAVAGDDVSTKSSLTTRSLQSRMEQNGHYTFEQTTKDDTTKTQNSNIENNNTRNTCLETHQSGEATNSLDTVRYDNKGVALDDTLDQSSITLDVEDSKVEDLTQNSMENNISHDTLEHCSSLEKGIVNEAYEDTNNMQTHSDEPEQTTTL